MSEIRYVKAKIKWYEVCLRRHCTSIVVHSESDSIEEICLDHGINVKYFEGYHFLGYVTLKEMLKATANGK